MFRTRLLRLLCVLAPVVVTMASVSSALDSAASPRQAAVLATVDSLHTARAVAGADSLLQAELIRARGENDADYELELMVRHGRLFVSFGQAARGAAILTDAVGVAEGRRDSLNLARSVRWLSLAESLCGRQAEAGILYRRLREIAVARRDSLHEGWALVGLGWETLNRGELEESRAHYARAVALFSALGNTDAEIWARNGYALALQRQGDYPAALALYRELTAIAQRTGYTIVEAMACNNTGSLLQKLGDPGTAVGHYERARQLQLSIHQSREAVIPALNIAVCFIELDQLDDAADLLGELDQLCADEGYPDLRSDVLYEMGRVRASQGRLTEAVALHRRIAAAADPLPVSSRVRNVTALARALAEMDSTAAALDVVTAGRMELLPRVAGEERLALDLCYGERLADAGQADAALGMLDGVATTAAASGLTGYRISARTRGGGIHLESDRPDSALAWFRLAAAAWEAERSVPLDPRWREQRGTYGQLIYPRLAALLLRDGADPVAAHDAVQVFKARTLSEAMLGPGAAGTPNPAIGASTGLLRTLQAAALRPQELFLDYYLGPEQSFLFAVTSTTLRVARLPGLPELGELLGNYRNLLRTADAGDDWQAAGRHVAEVLFADVQDLAAGATTILWAPDGPLHGIPLAALPLPGTPEPGLLLGDTRAIFRVPSAAALLHLRLHAGRAGPPPGAPILAVAGSRGGGSTPLAGPRQEARELERSFTPVQVLVDPTPGEMLAAGEAATGGILHLAAHTVVDPQHPWRSAFVLGGDDGDNLLSAGAIARGSLPFTLAVLSSCESLGSRAVAGEGQLGLSSAFLGAGVPVVVATPWPVSDRTALAFSRGFYAALAEGRTAAEALQEARNRLRARAETAPPRAWAGFVLLGDGDARFVLARRTPLADLRWWVVVGLVLAGSAGIGRARRRNRVKAV